MGGGRAGGGGGVRGIGHCPSPPPPNQKMSMYLIQAKFGRYSGKFGQKFGYNLWFAFFLLVKICCHMSLVGADVVLPQYWNRKIYNFRHAGKSDPSPPLSKICRAGGDSGMDSWYGHTAMVHQCSPKDYMQLYVFVFHFDKAALDPDHLGGNGTGNVSGHTASQVLLLLPEERGYRHRTRRWAPVPLGRDLQLQSIHVRPKNYRHCFFNSIKFYFNSIQFYFLFQQNTN